MLLPIAARTQWSGPGYSARRLSECLNHTWYFKDDFERKEAAGWLSGPQDAILNAAKLGYANQRYRQPDTG